MSHNLTILASEWLMGSETGWGDLDPEVVRKALREEGVELIRGILQDKETMKAVWSAGIEAAQEHAQQKAGAWIFEGVGVVLKRGMLWAALAGVIYSTGGWAALKTWLAFK